MNNESVLEKPLIKMLLSLPKNNKKWKSEKSLGRVWLPK